MSLFVNHISLITMRYYNEYINLGNPLYHYKRIYEYYYVPTYKDYNNNFYYLI